MTLAGEARRELTLRALDGESPTKLAEEYGVTRSRVYQMMDEAREADCKARAAEAEAEARFWRKIGEKRELDR